MQEIILLIALIFLAGCQTPRFFTKTTKDEVHYCFWHYGKPYCSGKHVREREYRVD